MATTTTTKNEATTIHTYSEIHHGGPHAGKRVWVREWRNAAGRCNRFEIFAVTAVR